VPAEAKRAPKQRQRWVGPVPAIRSMREEAFLKYFKMELGRDPTGKYFAVLHNLSQSEISC
jgi:hypothetical protein